MTTLRSELPTLVKKAAWNLKYRLLDYPILDPPEEAVALILQNVPEGASVLELGCGRGSLLRGLRTAGWNGHYCGVDISKYAIADAKKLADQRSTWVVSDIESFSSPFKWYAAVMIESAYYVNLSRFPAVLQQISGLLDETGFLLVRLHDLDKYRAYSEAIHQAFPHAKVKADNMLQVLAAPSMTSIQSGSDSPMTFQT